MHCIVAIYDDLHYTGCHLSSVLGQHCHQAMDTGICLQHKFLVSGFCLQDIKSDLAVRGPSLRVCWCKGSAIFANSGVNC